jgi:hypothetical protein
MKRLVIILVVCAAGAALVVWEVSHHNSKPDARRLPAADQRTLDGWAKHTFTPINQSGGFRKKVFGLPIRSEESLTPQQQEALHQAAYDMTMAFYLGTYEAYRKFRTPTEPKGLTEGRIEIMVRYCKSDWKNPDHTIPDDPEGAFRKFWEVVFLNKYVNVPVVNSTIGKPFWDAVALDGSEIDVTRYEAMPPALNQAFKEAVGYTVYPVSFVFTNAPEDILQQSGKLVCAVVKLLAEHPKAEPRFPVYCRYYWDESCGMWLPMHFATPFNLTRTREYVF